MKCLLLGVHLAPPGHVPVGVAVLVAVGQGEGADIGGRQPDSQQVYRQSGETRLANIKLTCRALYEVLVVVDDPVTETLHGPLLVVGSSAVLTLRPAGVVRSTHRQVSAACQYCRSHSHRGR